LTNVYANTLDPASLCQGKRFVWDVDEASIRHRSTLARHGASFEKAGEAFFDPSASASGEQLFLRRCGTVEDDGTGSIERGEESAGRLSHAAS
jgi:hypothetical protein